MRVHIRPYQTKGRCDGEIKKADTRRKKEAGRGKGCLVLAEAAIPSSGGQDRLKEAKETKTKQSRRLEDEAKSQKEKNHSKSKRKKVQFTLNLNTLFSPSKPGEILGAVRIYLDPFLLFFASCHNLLSDPQINYF